MLLKPRSQLPEFHPAGPNSKLTFAAVERQRKNPAGHEDWPTGFLIELNSVRPARALGGRGLEDAAATTTGEATSAATPTAAREAAAALTATTASTLPTAAATALSASATSAHATAVLLLPLLDLLHHVSEWIASLSPATASLARLSAGAIGPRR